MQILEDYIKTSNHYYLCEKVKELGWCNIVKIIGPTVLNSTLIGWKEQVAILSPEVGN